jgi:Ca2+-binding RTX toxin-like protein
MAQASYLKLDQLPSYNPDLLRGSLLTNEFNIPDIFSQGQADVFTDAISGFSLVNQQPDQQSGFSATLFKGNSGGYTIAVRGTDNKNQPIQDLLNADILGVVLQGQASLQLYDSYRYYKIISSPNGKVAYTDGELAAMASLLVYAADRIDGIALLPFPVVNIVRTWTSAITFASRVQSMISVIAPILNNDNGINAIPAGEVVNFTGHSLGGHVAALLAEMVGTFQGKSKVGDIVTYNAPGINALTYEVANWCGISTSTLNGVLGSQHLAIYGQGGPSVTAGLGQINGTRQSSFIETVLNPIDNHSIVKLSDVYAVKTVYATLFTSLSDAQADILLKASSNNYANSLENAIDGIGRIFGLNCNTTPDDRQSLYANINLLSKNDCFIAVSGRATLTLADVNLEKNAHVDFGAFLSLNALSTVVLSTIDATAIAKLKQSNMTLSLQWEADTELTSEQRNQGLAKFSTSWYADRTNLLADLAYRNKWDESNSFAGARGRGVVAGGHYVDVTNGIDISVGESLLITQKDYLFGGDGNDGADKLTGHSNDDHIYGGAGNDTLSGVGGNDYLEGNSGDDTISGGIGNDMLLGGAGTDTYQFSSGDGIDTIVDSDGLGAITFAGVTLTGGKAVNGANNVWQSTDKKFTFNLYSSDLVITQSAGSGSVTVKNWTNNQLGITLSNSVISSAPTVQHSLSFDSGNGSHTHVVNLNSAQ